MEKYFIVKEDCSLYKDYFNHKKSEKEIYSAYKRVCEEFGIESNQFFLSKNSFSIIPTDKDKEKFNSVLKKTNYGEFKKNSAPSKMWISLVKDIHNFDKPRLIYYFELLGHTWRERLFDKENVLYCSVESDRDIKTPNFVTEIKASEFYKVIEDLESEEQ